MPPPRFIPPPPQGNRAATLHVGGHRLAGNQFDARRYETNFVDLEREVIAVIGMPLTVREAAAEINRKTMTFVDRLRLCQDTVVFANAQAIQREFGLFIGDVQAHVNDDGYLDVPEELLAAYDLLRAKADVMVRRQGKFDAATVDYQYAKDDKKNLLKLAIMKQIAKQKGRRFEKSLKKRARLKEEYEPLWEEYLAQLEATVRQSPALARLTNACALLAQRLEFLGQTSGDIVARTRNLHQELFRLVRSKLKYRKYDVVRL
jgi:hypothetical protein